MKKIANKIKKVNRKKMDKTKMDKMKTGKTKINKMKTGKIKMDKTKMDKTKMDKIKMGKMKTKKEKDITKSIIKNKIYMDNNATTAVHPIVISAMNQIMKKYYANPSSSHILGIQARKSIENSRLIIANIFGVKPGEIIFTSSATESNNLLLRGFFLSNLNKGKRILLSPIEHASVLQTCGDLEKRYGAILEYLKVDKYGILDLEDLEKKLKMYKDIIICTVMGANNEIGTIEPVKQIGYLCKKYHVHFHCDATQYVGHYIIEPKKMGICSMTFAGHKMHGPRGIGGLYLKGCSGICSCITGGKHEHGLRAGTESPYLAGGLAIALKYNISRREAIENKVLKMRNYMRDMLIDKIPNIIINGHPTLHKFNTLSVCLQDINSRDFVKNLSLFGICMNVGSACSLGNRSKVLEAIGLPIEVENGAFRISLSEYNTMKECLYVVKVINILYNKLKNSKTKK
jgi:cysteine desulfurase